MPVPIVAGIFAFLTGWFARILGIQAIRFVAWKAILWVLVISIFPTVLYNVFSKLLGEAFTLYSNQVAGYQSESIVLHLTGCLGWLATKLKLIESFSLIISAAMFRMAIAMIPFIGRA